MNAISDIIGHSDYIRAWQELNPVVFFRDNKPYGLVSISDYRKGVMVYACTKDDAPFTFKMIRHIRKIGSVCPLYILHNKEREDIQDLIIKTFSKKFRCKKLKLEDMVVTIVRRR